ncbi:dipeptidase [Hymenobacter psoromatis]|uniref:dipeptidase n=1 Tax=Hymenobacter psoromatis TaxID=1484116 RepID=UPI001CBEC212|nr:dipeptidase [Hymenobacter psoromatis]
MTTPAYLTQHQNRFLEELMDWLRIPSVSADPKFHGDVLRAADFLKARLEEAGAANVELCSTAGNPIVYGEYFVGPDRPTVLVYGHYDVQPADPYELWNSPPFEPVIQDGNIYARGACDDKGQVYMHVKALEMMLRDGGAGVPCNLKFMFEGEEEVGSDNLGIFVKANQEKLKADVILISDTGILANDVPSIEVGLRGLSYHEVEVTGPNRDLHSGLYGGAVLNPINALCDMISSLHDADCHITIPGFYDNVAELSPAERAELAQAPFSEADFKQSIGLPAAVGEKGFTTPERTSIRPTLDVNGIWGGYIGEGAKTVIPGKAFAKISMRLVPHQTSDEITALFQKHFASIAPAGVTVQVRPHHGGEPVVTPTDSAAYRAAAKALTTTFGKAPVPTRGGGSIPIVAMFKSELGLDSVLLGFGLDSDAIHSPNEHFGVFNFLKGIETIPEFYKEYAAAR